MSEKKAYLVNVSGECQEVTLTDEKDELKQLYDVIKCTYIDIVRRKIRGVVYDIICDDEGALKSDRVVSSINSNQDVMFFGNLLIMRHDGPELASLSDEDVVRIKSAIVHLAISGGIQGISENILVCEYC